jgi:hypothetical protein
VDVEVVAKLGLVWGVVETELLEWSMGRVAVNLKSLWSFLDEKQHLMNLVKQLQQKLYWREVTYLAENKEELLVVVVVKVLKEDFLQVEQELADHLRLLVWGEEADWSVQLDGGVSKLWTLTAEE